MRFGARRCANVIVSASALCTAGMFFGGLANHHLSLRDVRLGFGNLGCFSIYLFIYFLLIVQRSAKLTTTQRNCTTPFSIFHADLDKYWTKFVSSGDGEGWRQEERNTATPAPASKLSPTVTSKWSPFQHRNSCYGCINIDFLRKKTWCFNIYRALMSSGLS